MNNQSGHHAGRGGPGNLHQQHSPRHMPGPGPARGPSAEEARKDTVIVRPKQTVTVIFDADNPGQRLAHCHEAYHAERGMPALFSYSK